MLRTRQLRWLALISRRRCGLRGTYLLGCSVGCSLGCSCVGWLVCVQLEKANAEIEQIMRSQESFLRIVLFFIVIVW